MADRKISDLDAIAGSSVDVDADYIEIIDTSESSAKRRNKKITPAELVANTSVFTASGIATANQRSRTVQAKVGEICVSVTDAKNDDGNAVAGDGSQDDTTGIQAAIDAGDVIYFPKPSVRYKITAALTVGSNKRIYGAGFSEIHQATTQTDTFQIEEGSSNVIIEGLHFSGAGTSTTGKASIHFMYTSSIVTDVIIRNCKFTDPSVGGIGTDPSQRVVISGNIFNGNGNAGIYLSNCLDCTVTGNVFVGGAQTKTGIQIRNGSVGGGRIVISGNVLRAINDSAQGAIMFLDNSPQEVTIVGNQFIDNAGEDIQCAFTNAATLHITGNTMSGAGKNSILLTSVTDAIISGNLITTCALAGIRMNAGCQYNHITGNKFFDCNSDNDAKASIWDLGSGVNVITNNFVKTQYNNTNGIKTSGGSGSNMIFGNDVSQCAISQANRMSVHSTDTVRQNKGWVTENGGTGSIASGATTATISHGCNRTPTAAQIRVVFTEQGTNDYGRWWISTITSTQFTVNVSADPGASNLDFSWAVSIL